MAPLTWREVSAPNFSSVNQAQALVGESISNAANIMQKSIAAYGDQRTRENSANFMGQILNGTPLDQIQGVNPAYLDPSAFDFALNKQKVDQANALGYARIAQMGKGKGKGAAAGASDTIPVAGGVGSEYLTADGQIVPGIATNVPTVVPLKGKAQPLPTAPTVVPVGQPTSQAVPTVENFRPMPASGPVRNDETSQVAPIEAAPVDVASTPTSSLLAQATSTFGAPVDNGGSLRPVAGPLRGAAVKGNDGGAQIFPEGFQDINAIRELAATNPEAANRALIENQRLQRTLTMTNGLDVQKGNFEAAASAQKFREGDRKEQEDLRKLDDQNTGRFEGNNAVQNALDRSSAIASLPSNLTADQRAEALKPIDLADKTGLFDAGDPNRPVVAPDGTIITPGDNPATQRLNIIAGMTATPEGAKSVAEATSTPEGAAKFNAAVDAALKNSTAAGRGLERQELQHQADLDKYNLDRNSNLDISAINDFTKGLQSDADAGTVAQQVMKNPRFEGSTVTKNDMASLIERVAAQAKVSPAIAGGMVANSLRGGKFGDGVKGLFYNGAELTYDPEKLDRLISKARDPITGQPSDRLLNDITNLKESDRQRDNLNSSWEQLKKAQAQLTRDTGQQALRGTKESERIVEMSKRFYEAAEKQYEEDRKKFLSTGGVARQNRGEPAAPAIAVTPQAPQQGPRRGTVYQTDAERILQEAIGREIKIPVPQNSKYLGIY